MALHTMFSTGSRLALGYTRLMVQRVSAYTTSSKVQMGFGSHSSDNDPDVLHKEKERNLQGKSETMRRLDSMTTSHLDMEITCLDWVVTPLGSYDC